MKTTVPRRNIHSPCDRPPAGGAIGLGCPISCRMGRKALGRAEVFPDGRSVL